MKSGIQIKDELDSNESGIVFILLGSAAAIILACLARGGTLQFTLWPAQLLLLLRTGHKVTYMALEADCGRQVKQG
jgi:hypothetical protein